MTAGAVAVGTAVAGATWGHNLHVRSDNYPRHNYARADHPTATMKI